MTIIHCLGSGLVGSFVIKKLLEENYIIQDDFDIVVEACEERYDVLISGKLKNEDK